MKRGVPLLTILLILILMSFSVYADETVQNLESRIIESFDDPDTQQWYVRGSKFSADGYPLIPTRMRGLRRYSAEIETRWISKFSA